MSESAFRRTWKRKWARGGVRIDTETRGRPYLVEAPRPLRIYQRLIYRVLLRVEEAYLKSHGWRKYSEGWQTPVWHPKRDKEDPRGEERYDQNHAVNSQRKHGSNKYWEVLGARQSKVNWMHRQYPLKALGNWMFWSAGLTLDNFLPAPWSYVSSVVFALGLILGTAYIYWQARREAFLDEAERLLRGGPKPPYR